MRIDATETELKVTQMLKALVPSSHDGRMIKDMLERLIDGTLYEDMSIEIRICLERFLALLGHCTLSDGTIQPYFGILWDHFENAILNIGAKK